MSIFSEEISRNNYYQNNYKSKFLGGCFTYDWNIECNENKVEDTVFEIIFTSLEEGDVAIMKAILIGKSGHRLRLTKMIDEPQKVVYRGKLPKGESNARVRYWRPNNNKKMNISDRIKVEERVIL